MSATSNMRASGSEAVHQLVERIGQSGSNLRSEMGIDLSAPRTAMAEILLNDAQIDSGAQQMRRVGVAQRVDVRLFMHAGSFAGVAKRLSEIRRPDWLIDAARRRE